MRSSPAARTSLVQDWCLHRRADFSFLSIPLGPVAQLIERLVRNEEVVGLIPIRSTNLDSNPFELDLLTWNQKFKSHGLYQLLLPDVVAYEAAKPELQCARYMEDVK